MRIVIQRVKNSKVEVSGKVVGEIGEGMTLLVCMEKGDTADNVLKASEKILKMRIFSNPERDDDRMDLNVIQAKKQILAISQFTLAWRGEKGHRPSFDSSMSPEEANRLFEKFCEKLEEAVPVEKGVFGEHMDVHLRNDGPVTFGLDF